MEKRIINNDEGSDMKDIYLWTIKNDTGSVIKTVSGVPILTSTKKEAETIKRMNNDVGAKGLRVVKMVLNEAYGKQ